MQHLFTHLRAARFTPSVLLASINLSVSATCQPFTDRECPVNIKACIGGDVKIFDLTLSRAVSGGISSLAATPEPFAISDNHAP